MIITLKRDDVRLGKLDDDGAIVACPAVDVFERPIERRNANMRRVDKHSFVLIPPDKDGEVEIVPPVDPSIFTAPPVESTVKKGK